MKIVHGLYIDPATGKKSRLYHIWEDMKSRCVNPKNSRYKDYGGRGIRVCDEWRDSFKSFYDWAMANGYDNALTIDRLKVDGNYEPSNCKWATQKEQGNNRRSNRIITLDGISKTMTQWCEDIGGKKHVIKNRLKRGWDLQRALKTPIKK